MRRQEHDRQGRVPGDRRARTPLRARCWPTSGTRRRRADATGCSTTGSSEACMLAGLALKRRWRARVADPARLPNLVMGANVQVCWEKFCRYWDVEPRFVPMSGDRFHLDAASAVALVRREHDWGRRHPRLDLRWQLRADRRDRGGARRPRGRRRTGRADPRRRGLRGDDRARSSTRTSSGTSAWLGSPRSTPRVTSTGWSTPASAGCCGATRLPCPKT